MRLCGGLSYRREQQLRGSVAGLAGESKERRGGRLGFSCSFPQNLPLSLSCASLPCGSSPPPCGRVLGRTGKQGLEGVFLVSGLMQAFCVALSADSLLPLPFPLWPAVLPFSSIASTSKSGFRRFPQDGRTPRRAERDVEAACAVNRKLGPLGLGWWEERSLRARGDLVRERACPPDCQQSARPAWPPNSASAF